MVSPATVPNAAGSRTPSPPTASGRAWSLPRQGPGKSWQERVGGLLSVPIPPRSLKPRIATITLKGHFQPFKGLAKFYST